MNTIPKPETRDLRPVCPKCIDNHWPTEGCTVFTASRPDQYGNVVISPLPKAREPMGEAILREAKARMAQQAYRERVALLEAARKRRIEGGTDDRVLQENIKVSWSSAICDDCYAKRRLGNPIRAKDGSREQCCDCGMPTTDGIYIRVDPMKVRYPRVVRDG